MTNILLILAVVLAVFFLVHLVNGEDDEEKFFDRLLVVPIVSLLILIPLGFFAAFLGGTLEVVGLFHHSLSFDNPGAVFTMGLYLLIGFFLLDLLNKIAKNVLFFGLHVRSNWALENTISILADTVIIFVVATVLPDVRIKGLFTALSIAVFFKMLEWLVERIGKYGGKQRRI